MLRRRIYSRWKPRKDVNGKGFIANSYPAEKVIAGIMLLVSVTAGGCALADRMSGISDAKALQKTGEPAEATILKIWDTGMTVNDDPVVRFLLEVHPAGKPGYQAETKLRISRLSISRYQPGAVVPVRIDPRHPNHVALDIYDFGKHDKSPL